MRLGSLENFASSQLFWPRDLTPPSDAVVLIRYRVVSRIHTLSRQSTHGVTRRHAFRASREASRGLGYRPRISESLLRCQVHGDAIRGFPRINGTSGMSSKDGRDASGSSVSQFSPGPRGHSLLFTHFDRSVSPLGRTFSWRILSRTMNPFGVRVTASSRLSKTWTFLLARLPRTQSTYCSGTIRLKHALKTY
jgi:hypothetical protein